MAKDDERRLIIAFGGSLTAGGLIAAAVEPPDVPGAKAEGVAFALLGIAILLGEFSR